MENVDIIQKRFSLMGFLLKDGDTKPIYYKKYKDFDDYELKIELNIKDYKQSKIEYGTASDRKTTENLHQKETFVVIECFNRLLEMGYSPKEIILEKAYPSGKKEKGQFLDILVTKDGRPYFMIECKQYGDEYKKELRNLETNGGQLFTYYTNDREVKAICLYSSTVINDKIVTDYKIIDTSNLNGSNKTEIYQQWNKDYIANAIFNNKYDISSNSIIIDNLKDIEEDKKLYNEFAKILRKYAVSDLTNAYNKLFNLFLCKIVDEDKAFHKKSYDIQFQWRNNETSYDVLDRLSNLYKEGIYTYLGIQVTDYSFEKIKEHIQSISNGNIHISEELEKEFKELRFIKNNEFSFIEVFNEETFKQNSLILKDVVKLFENVKIKYSDKHQILGDFFERLLNIGIKQTEGQFFTPIPIANFIVNSIPYEDIIKSKIEKGEHCFLPYMIDYACGAGHFLTEYMHRIEELLKDDKNKCILEDLSLPQNDNYNIWKAKSFGWAKEFVYGIEKDYRLTKTSKIACFLNGDGDANIVTANGLDSFDSEAYRGYKQLYKKNTDYCKGNFNFDCVIANPPYAVDDFKETLKNTSGEHYGLKNFDLYKNLGPNSDDIECLFIERTSQLLKQNGYAGIVFIDSILNSSGIYQNTRKMLLEDFKIKAIVNLRDGAFLKTKIKTIILFLQKRNPQEKLKIKELIDNFKSTNIDFSFNNVTNVISKYVQTYYQDITFKDYITLLSNSPNENMKKFEICLEYKDNLVVEIEKKINKTKDVICKEELCKKINDIKNGKTIIDYTNLIDEEYKKLYFYLLNDGTNTVIVSSKKDDREDLEKMLGYKCSERKGNEGLKEISANLEKELDKYTNRSKVSSKLYNPHNIFDETKVNYYIYKNFEDSLANTQIHENVKSYINIQPLNNLMDFSYTTFDYAINLIQKEKIKITSKKYQIEPIGRFADVTKGSYITKDSTVAGDIPVVAGGKTSPYKHNLANRNGNVITVSASGKNAGYVNYWKDPIFASDCNTIQSKDEEIYRTKYIYYMLESVQEDIFNYQKGAGQGHIYERDLRRIQIPKMPPDIQDKLISELLDIDNGKFTVNEQANIHIYKKNIINKYIN